MIETEREVFKPWHFRDRLEPTRTYSGRVVYERPHHWFLLSDIERISRNAKPAPTPQPDKWEGVFRALWRVSAGTALPYPTDHFESIIAYLKWAIENSLEVIKDPIGTLKQRTYELVIALVRAFELEDWIEIK
jgi:hypothetical protein